MIPGCDVSFERTTLHHIIWWRNGGHTDLANLTPVCSHHHAQIHTGHITLQVGTAGEIIVTTAEGTMTTGPPQPNAA